MPPVLIIFILFFQATQAQNNSSSSDGSNPLVTTIVIVLICVGFLIGFSSVFFQHCSTHRPPDIPPSNQTTTWPLRRGLKPELIDALPIINYVDVRKVKAGNEALECAICITDFSDEDVLRLLPSCSHVFHVDCIDVWLQSKTTCPVCRADLSAPAIDENRELEQEPSSVEQLNSTTGDRYSLRIPEELTRQISRYPRASSLREEVRWYQRGGSGGLRFLLRSFSWQGRSAKNGGEGTSTSMEV